MLFLLLACATTTDAIYLTCDVALVSVEPTVAAPGDEVTLTATPLTEDWDTAIRVGGLDADIVSVTREGCDACDSCNADQGCACNEDCDACDLICDACVETVVFTVPSLDEGEHGIVLFNANGGSMPLTLTVAEPDSGL